MSSINIAFRVDASAEIGTGHVMRCLTLADALKQKGASIRFICRHLPDYLEDKVQTAGHELSLLKPLPTKTVNSTLAHATWLNVNPVDDAEASKLSLADKTWHWLIIDHYALDQQWEECFSDLVTQIMVIDDLADRHHYCHLLLDQTYGRQGTDYSPLVPKGCEILSGASYALLRAEFSAHRKQSLERRKQFMLNNILVTMGGVDKHNVSAHVLSALANISLPQSCQVTVVIGGAATHIGPLKKLSVQLPYSVNFQHNVSNMAQLMSNSDLIIGAAGSSLWEGFCLGVPTVAYVSAENQHTAANILEQAGIAKIARKPGDIAPCIAESISDLSNLTYYKNLIGKITSISDGTGVHKLVAKLDLVGDTQ